MLDDIVKTATPYLLAALHADHYQPTDVRLAPRLGDTD
jgi:hypothetical protein